MADKYGF
jgi:hypothetical protein